MAETNEITKKERTTKQQRLSAMVKTRLLFRREITIDRGHGNLFNLAYFERLVAMKRDVDSEMTKTLTGSATLAILIYLVGVGTNAKMPIWGIELSSIPGVLIFLSFSCSFMHVLATLGFMNSLTYDALIDQVILDATEDGVTDADMLKASFHKEWLFFKVLRADFSLYVPVYIKMRRLGRFLIGALGLVVTLVILAPFIALMFVSPYLAITFLPDGWVGSAAKTFAVICALTSFLVVFLTNIAFKCDVEQEANPNDDANNQLKPVTKAEP